MRSLKGLIMARARVSKALPGSSGTMIVMGREGNGCARLAPAQMAIAAASEARIKRRMAFSLVFGVFASSPFVARSLP